MDKTREPRVSENQSFYYSRLDPALIKQVNNGRAFLNLVLEQSLDLNSFISQTLCFNPECGKVLNVQDDVLVIHKKESKLNKLVFCSVDCQIQASITHLARKYRRKS